MIRQEWIIFMINNEFLYMSLATQECQGPLPMQPLCRQVLDSCAQVAQEPQHFFLVALLCHLSIFSFMLRKTGL